MKPALRFLILFVFSICFNPAMPKILAEPLPLKRVVELAISHSTVTGATAADEQRAFASYHEARNQYLPTLVVGSGLGATWGYPLSLEGSAPSIVNVTAQSAVLNPSVRDFVRAARQEWTASSLQAKDARSQVVQDAVLSYAELSKWEGLLNHLQQQQEQDERMEQIVEERIRAGVDNLLARSKAQLATARMRLHLAQAHGAIDVLRDHLSKLTGLPAPSIETAAESIASAIVLVAFRRTVVVAVAPPVAALTTHLPSRGLRARIRLAWLRRPLRLARPVGRRRERPGPWRTGSGRACGAGRAAYAGPQ